MKHGKERKEHGFEPMLTYEQVSKLLGVSVIFLKKAKRSMGLPHYKIGAAVRFRLSEVEGWLQQRHAV